MDFNLTPLADKPVTNGSQLMPVYLGIKPFRSDKERGVGHSESPQPLLLISPTSDNITPLITNGYDNPPPKYEEENVAIPPESPPAHGKLAHFDLYTDAEMTTMLKRRKSERKKKRDKKKDMSALKEELVTVRCLD